MLSQFRPYISKGLQKVKLNKLAHKIYYNHVHGFNAAITDTLPAVDRCLRYVKDHDIAGDYYEFGVFKGYTFWHTQHQAGILGLSAMKFYGFDSFEGLPEVEGIDKTKDNDFYKGQYRCGKDQVIENLNSKGVDWDRTVLVEGYFDQSLTDSVRQQHSMEKLALALIDCDLYSSTVDVLDFIWPVLIDGSVLMFDDWNCFDRSNEKGQRRAFYEFLHKHPEWKAESLFGYGPYGEVFEMHLTR